MEAEYRRVLCLKCGRSWEVNIREVWYTSTVKYCGDCAPEPPKFNEELPIGDFEKLLQKRDEAEAAFLKELKEADRIADNMRDYWASLASGAER